MVAITLALSAGLAILIGLLVLVFPKIIRLGLGFYLIIWGILQFFGS
jgi:hypothetical protein